MLMSMRHDEPSGSDLERLGRYAANEVEIERDLHLHTELYPLSLKEREIWLLDQRINDRGIAMDLDLVADMLAIVEAHRETLDQKLARRPATPSRPARKAESEEVARCTRRRSNKSRQGCHRDLVGTADA